VLTDLEVAIQERNALVHIGHLGTINGDSLHIQQLFQNLISNALKYSRHNVRPEISITAKETVGSKTGLALSEQEEQQFFYEITIKDNGQGFSNEEAVQIFKIFQRLPQHRNESMGTGIGLAIVQRVVENHKGYIVAEGVPGEGATFKVFLPVLN
jgi:signal transduction histidine kinase